MKAIDKFVVLLDGEFMKDKNSLFKEFSMQLKFPGYFGYNWDSFGDIMPTASRPRPRTRKTFKMLLTFNTHSAYN
jgi:RNAse (barnase) inhibitor barstar